MSKLAAPEQHGAQWKSLEELSGTSAASAGTTHEFPDGAATWLDDHNRREFLKLMAASLALSGAGCTVQQPAEEIVPFVAVPERSPSRSLYFATAILSGGYALGALARSHQGRPVKIEGNPLHPASLGATDAQMQASILDLYDPDRSQAVLRHGRISHWQEFVADWKPLLAGLRASGGAGFRILSGPVTSPTLSNQIQTLLSELPQARWHVYGDAPHARAGGERAFGRRVHQRVHFDVADVIVALDADPLDSGPARLRLTREFAERRSRAIGGDGPMNRLYVVEPSPTCTGATADVRIPLGRGRIASLLAALARRLGVLPGDESGPPVIDPALLDAIVSDLNGAGPRGVVLVGEAQPPAVHALAHAVNARLGSFGTTISFTEPLEPETAATIEELAGDMRAGRVSSLLILDANPVFDAPADLEFGRALRDVQLTVHYGLHHDETAQLCQWHLPAAHTLEIWSDARGEDGTATIIQPLIQPLYGNHSPHELFQVLLDQPGGSGDSAVREFWKNAIGGQDFDAVWQEALGTGVVPNTAFPGIEVEPVADLATGLAEDPAFRSEGTESGDAVELVFRPDPTIENGRYANNAWLQELPKPLTKLTWGGAALISPALANEKRLASGDVVRISRGDAAIEIPVWILPGQAERSITLHYGNGRRAAGRVGRNVGTDVYPLRASNAMWWASDARLEPTGEHRSLPSTQTHFRMEDRNPVRTGTWHELQQHPDHPPFLQSGNHGTPDEPPTLYPEWDRDTYEWGMCIDLSVCTGCSACVVACQAENNIPVVGPQEVERSHEMHWLRIDTYFSGPAEDPAIHHQPMLCMHCEHAPCEPVCPVAATTHSPEGLNEMTYNRCIGTRYCSNNCPYKVRRFNFFDYQAETRELPVLQLMQNPDVTVRSRGVMEKCTYCVQRINAARIQAKIEGRPIADGDIMTACEAACPARAITFGNISDPDSRVSRRKRQSIHYAVLEDLNTRPRTTYLAEIRNPPAVTGGSPPPA